MSATDLPVPLILLDFDGVCAETEEPARRVLAAVVEEAFAVPADQVLAAVADKPGLTLSQLLTPLSAQFGFTVTEEARLAVLRRNEQGVAAMLAETPLRSPSGLIEALTQCRQGCGARVRICSNSSARRLAHALDALGAVGRSLRDLVDSVHAARIYKPDPQVYADAIGCHYAGTGHLPARVVIVEDSPAGATAAVAARGVWPELTIDVLGYTPLTLAPAVVREGLLALELTALIDQEPWRFLPTHLAAALGAAG